LIRNWQRSDIPPLLPARVGKICHVQYWRSVLRHGVLVVLFTTKARKEDRPSNRKERAAMHAGVETCATSPKRGACPVPRSCWPSWSAWIEHSGLARVCWICWSQGQRVWRVRALLVARLARSGVGSLLAARLARFRRQIFRAREFGPAGNIWLEMAAQAASATTRLFGLGRPMVLSRWKVQKTIPFSIRKGCGAQEAVSQGIKAPPPWPKLVVASGFLSPAHRARVVTPRGWRLHVNRR
jgi:hypothetical protein